MNEMFRHPAPRPTTQGAEGLPRWRWTLAEFERLFETGHLKQEDHVELIDGEIVPMAAKGNRHDLVKDELASSLLRATQHALRYANESGWAPVEGTYCEPDLRFFPRSFQPRSVPGGEVLLLIEVADSSLSFDLGRKAEIYAGLGVREYWVVEAQSLVVHVHTEPGASGYGKVVQVGPEEAMTPVLLPGVSVALGALDID